MMKKNFRILTLVLSCLLLIGVMVGISVSASEEPTVAIARKAISYEGAVKIAYAIDAQNIADDQEVKLLFSYDEMTTPTGKLDETKYEYVNGISGTQTLDGVTYLLAFSDGFAPAEMTKPVYALPVVVDADNNIITSGASHKLSIFEYCTTRFSGSYTDDQLELYMALLRYGASVQEALVGTSVYPEEELDKYGWADAFYVANITTKVDGVVDSTETVCYRESDITIEAPKTYNGKIFNGFADAEGNALTMYGADKTASTWNKYKATLPIGVTELTYNYKTAGTLQTWTDADGNDITLTSEHSAPYATGSNLAFNEVIEGRKSLYVNNGKLTLSTAEFTTQNNNHWRPIEILNQNERTGAVGKTYVFETDLQIDFPVENQLSQTVLGDFGMTSRTDYGANETFFLFLTFNRTSATQFKIQSMDSTKGNWSNLITGLNFGEKYNLRIEYKINSIGTCGSSTASTAKGTVSMYINGELKTTYEATGYASNTSASNSQFGGVGLLSWDYKKTGAHTWYFDNTYLATED